MCRLLERQKLDNGNAWPETIAVVLWGTDNIKTYGESLAQVCKRDIYVDKSGFCSNMGDLRGLCLSFMLSYCTSVAGHLSTWGQLDWHECQHHPKDSLYGP